MPNMLIKAQKLKWAPWSWEVGLGWPWVKTALYLQWHMPISTTTPPICFNCRGWNRYSRLPASFAVVMWHSSRQGDIYCELFFFGCSLGLVGILLPWSGIRQGPMTVKAPSPNHWAAREFPYWELLERLLLFLIKETETVGIHLAIVRENVKRITERPIQTSNIVQFLSQLSTFWFLVM